MTASPLRCGGDVLEVACIKWGRKYGPEYVNILERSVARQLRLSHRFICYTDDATGVNSETRPLPHGVEGWWNKLYLFSFDREILLLDLDCVITGPLDPLVNGDHFMTIKDKWNAGYNSSAVHIVPDMSRVWDGYLSHRPERHLHGDQDWLNIVPGFDIANCYEDGLCASYKAEVKGRGLASNTALVYFHGDPKPHAVRETFVSECWR